MSATARTRAIEIEVGQRHVEDFGEAVPWPAFEGRLLTARGDAIAGPGKLLALPEEGGYQQLPIDEHGEVHSRLAPGRYRLEAHVPTGKLKIDGVLDFSVATGPQDWTVAGARLRGMVELGPDDPRPTILLDRERPGRGPKRRRLTVADDATFLLDGLPAGHYRLWSPDGEVMEASSGSPEFELSDGETERRLTLRYRPRTPTR